MPGSVQLAAAAFPTPTHWVLLILQCRPCEARSGTYTTWSAVTDDSGRRWSIYKTAIPGTPRQVAFTSADDGWTDSGYVTDDGGKSWRRPDPGHWFQSVSAADGTLWAIEVTEGTSRRSVVRTTATGTPERVPRDSIAHVMAGWIIATGSASALLTGIGDQGQQYFETADAGATWHQTGQACPAGYLVDGLPNAGDGAVWQLCRSGVKIPGVKHLKFGRNPSFRLATSSDSGRTWVATTPPLSKATELVMPVSIKSGWMSSWSGRYYRTTDSGQTWKLMLSLPDQAQPGAGAGPVPEAFVARGARAEIVNAEPVQHGTNFVVWSTRDDGAHWQTSPVVLPAS